jgi:hypothetical protein
LFIVIFLFFKNNCVGSIVDSFLPMHAPKIICNFHDALHVHSKFYGENVSSFIFIFFVSSWTMWLFSFSYFKCFLVGCYKWWWCG